MAIGYTKVGGTVYEIGGSGAMVLTKTKIKTVSATDTVLTSTPSIGTRGEFAEYDGLQLVMTITSDTTTTGTVTLKTKETNEASLIGAKESTSMRNKTYASPIYWKYYREYGTSPITRFLVYASFSSPVQAISELSKIYLTQEGCTANVDIYGYKFA